MTGQQPGSGIPLVAWAIACSAAAVPSAAMQPESVLRISDREDCPECTVALDRILSVASPRDTIEFRRLPRPTIAIDSKGFVIVAPGGPTIALAAFSSDGKLHGTHGRIGDSQGDFTAGSMSIAVGRGDSLHVVQHNVYRLLGPQASSSERSVQIPLAPRTAIPLAGDSLLVLQPILRPPNGRAFLHILDQSGNIARSFGILSDASGAGYFDQIMDVAATSDRTEFWLTSVNRYQLDQFDRGGRNTVRVVRDAPWFAPYEEYREGEAIIVPPRPRVSSVRADDRGRLWVLITVADPDWTPYADDAPVVQSFVPNDVYDTMLEVIDIRQRSVVVRHRFDDYIFEVDGGAYASIRPSPAGGYTYDLWSASIANHPSSGGRS